MTCCSKINANSSKPPSPLLQHLHGHTVSCCVTMDWLLQFLIFWFLTFMLLIFHLRVTLGSSQVKEVLSLLKRQKVEDVRVEEKMSQVKLDNYKFICGGVSHLVLLSAVFFLRDAISTAGLFNCGFFCLLLGAYFHNVLVGNCIISVTPKRMKQSCYMVHLMTLSLSVFASLGATDVISLCSMQPFVAATRFSLLGFLDKSVTIPFRLQQTLACIWLLLEMKRGRHLIPSLSVRYRLP